MKARLYCPILFSIVGWNPSHAFGPLAASKSVFHSPVSQSGFFPGHFGSPLFLAGNNKDGDRINDEEDDEEESLALRDDDWRAFRAKLVMGEKTSPSKENDGSSSVVDGDLDGIGSLFDDFPDAKMNASDATAATKRENVFTPLDPSQWAYEAGDVIEQGAVILGGVEQEFGFGLRQQYFHKVAILVLDHGPTFTKGIILNRPTDLLLEDDVNPGKQWRVWFGGDVEGLNANHPDITCLHSLNSAAAAKASVSIIDKIQWTSFHNAKKLVKGGVATVDDFWVFVGYAGWAPGQLAGELTRSSWYMVATDSQTLLQELARQGQGADPRDAGLDTWTKLMNMIGRKETADQHTGGFDDLMLKEWALEHLLSGPAGGGAGPQKRNPQEFNTNPELVETLIRRSAERNRNSLLGVCARASSAERSPFLLESQELHKSIVLVLSDDDVATIGVVLNRPSTKGLIFKVEDPGTGASTTLTIPVRYGGPYAVKGQESLLYLHNNDDLRRAGIGSPVGADDGFWKCTSKDVTLAVGKGLARAQDFLVISGVSVWERNLLKGKNGLEGEIDIQRFEIVAKSCQDNVWVTLVSQHMLSESNFSRTLAISEKAWSFGAESKDKVSTKDKTKSSLLPLLGLGENFDEEDDSVVFKSDVKVAKLSDDALRRWCATFLLGNPSMKTDLY
jgi:putative transcriptional regulator